MVFDPLPPDVRICPNFGYPLLNDVRIWKINLKKKTSSEYKILSQRNKQSIISTLRSERCTESKSRVILFKKYQLSIEIHNKKPLFGFCFSRKITLKFGRPNFLDPPSPPCPNMSEFLGPPPPPKIRTSLMDAPLCFWKKIHYIWCAWTFNSNK